MPLLSMCSVLYAAFISRSLLHLLFLAPGFDDLGSQRQTRRVLHALVHLSETSTNDRNANTDMNSRHRISTMLEIGFWIYKTFILAVKVLHDQQKKINNSLRLMSSVE